MRLIFPITSLKSESERQEETYCKLRPVNVLDIFSNLKSSWINQQDSEKFEIKYIEAKLLPFISSICNFYFGL